MHHVYKVHISVLKMGKTIEVLFLLFDFNFKTKVSILTSIVTFEFYL